MKKLVVLALIAGGLWYAWNRGWLGATADDAQDPVASAQDGIAIDGDDLQLDTPPQSGNDSQPPANEGQRGSLPPDLAKRMARADAEWKRLVEAGEDPTLHRQAPSLARIYSDALMATYNDPTLASLQRRLIDTRLTPLGDRLFFSRFIPDDPNLPMFVRHIVSSGENPDRIGRQYGMSAEHVMLVNDIDDPRRLRAGDPLKVINVKEDGFFIHVSKSQFTLDFFICGLFARRYPVGIGHPETPTPVGRARIDLREWHPQWTTPEGQVLPYGHPDNILGPVWLRLKQAEINQGGIGIHGFDGDPDQAVRVRGSNGCVRMRNDDAIQVYRMLTRVQYDSNGALLQRAPMWVRIVE